MKNLKKLRIDRNMKQSEVAKYLKVSQATYSRYESDHIKVESDTLIKLSEFFNVSIDYILGNIDVPMTPAEARFDKEVDHLTDEEVFKKYKLNIDGKPLTFEEAKKMLKLIRALGEED